MHATDSGSFSEQIQHAVFHHPHLKKRPVHCLAENGKVTIQGSVNSYFEKQMAQEAVRRIDGTSLIENQLVVVGDYFPE